MARSTRPARRATPSRPSCSARSARRTSPRTATSPTAGATTRATRRTTGASSNKLTVNYGLRYEYTPPTFEGYYPDGYSNFNPDLPNPAANGRLGASEFAGEGEGRTGKDTMYEAWPWGLSPRVGAVYSVDDNTVRPAERRAHLRIGEEHRRQLALERLHRRLQRADAGRARQLRVQLGSGLAGLARAAVPRPEHAQRQRHSLLAAVRLGPASRVLHLDAQHAAPAPGPLRRRSRVQRAAGPSSDHEPPQPEPGRPGDLPGVRPAVRGARVRSR